MLTFRHLAPLSLLVLAGAVAAADASKKDAGPTTPTTSTSTASSAERGRDWSRIDTDKDGYVSPEEMEKFLADNPGPLKK